MKKKTVFKVGSYVVYPSHGVAVVKRIEESVKGTELYFLQLIDSEMTIILPTDQSDVLRPVISKSKIKEVYKILKAKDNKSKLPWSKRYRKITEKLYSGDTFKIAEVLRDLNMIRIEKDLSFGERMMFDVAKKLLVKEISFSKNVQESVVIKEIENALGEVEKLKGNHRPEIGDNVKVHLRGESPWAVCLGFRANGNMVGKINNNLVASGLHGFKYGDIVEFQKVSKEGLTWLEAVGKLDLAKIMGAV